VTDVNGPLDESTQERELHQHRDSLHVMAGSLAPKHLPGFSTPQPGFRARHAAAPPRGRRAAYVYYAAILRASNRMSRDLEPLGRAKERRFCVCL